MYKKVYIINPSKSVLKAKVKNLDRSKAKGAETMAKKKASKKASKKISKAVKKAKLKVAIRKASRTLKALHSKAKTVGLPITEPLKKYRVHSYRGRKVAVPKSRFVLRYHAKAAAGGIKKSFRPRLYISKGRVYASPLSDASQHYTVNPGKATMRRRKSKLPAFLRKHSKRRKSYRRNPVNIKSLASKGNLITAASIGGGFILGAKATKFITKVPFLSDGMGRKFAGLIHILLGGAIAGMAKKDLVKKVGMGFMGAGVYDLVSRNVPQIGISPMEGVDLDMDGDYALVGETSDVSGDYALVGETSDVGAGDVVLVGEDDFMGDDSVFASI